MDEKLFKLYAQFAVKSGVNLQKGQTLLINSPIEAAWFARLCAEQAYAAGAREVVVHYADEKLSRLRMKETELAVLEEIKPWKLASYMDYMDGEGNTCILSIVARDPEIYKGIDTDKVSRAGLAMDRAMKDYYNLVMGGSMQWCVLSVPSPAWNAKVFPGETPPAAEEKMWKAILKVSRVEGGDPVGEWAAHAKESQRRTDALNALKLDALHLRAANGTDLTVGLADDNLFVGVLESTQKGIPFLANVPSEEIFTAPHKNRVEGTVKSSLPYVYNGNLIEGIVLEFKDGAVVKASAEKGDDVLQQMLGADEGAKRLGEIALVPASSPIRQTGILFYNTLFDENAACHMALGRAYPTCVKGGTGMSREQLDEKGLNDSLIHEDIMIGTPDMAVEGIKKDGSRVPVFEKGEWCL